MNCNNNFTTHLLFSLRFFTFKKNGDGIYPWHFNFLYVNLRRNGSPSSCQLPDATCLHVVQQFALPALLSKSPTFFHFFNLLIRM